MVLSALTTLLITAPPIHGYNAVDHGGLHSHLVEYLPNRTKGKWRRPTDEQLMTVIEAADVAGQEYDIDPLWLLSVMGIESGYRHWIMGDNGHAFGLGQLHYRTARGTKRTGSPCHPTSLSSPDNRRNGCNREHLLDPVINARVMAWWFNMMKKKAPGDEAVIYNCGYRCCIKGKGKRCKHMSFTRTTRKYYKRYRELRSVFAKRGNRLSGVSVSQ